MTPTDELVLSKLHSNEKIRNELHPSELKYLINLVTREVNKAYGIFEG